MKINAIFSSFIILSLFFSCGKVAQKDITVSNNTNLALEDALVEIPVTDLKAKMENFNEKAIQLYHGDKELAYQMDDRNRDGQPDVLVFVTNLQANETAKLKLISTQNVAIEQPFTKRTQAEISKKVGGKFEDKKYIGGKFENVSYVRVPAEHTDHDTYFRYEGPGWESDKVGYRFYLDWRNATDIFGKKTTQMVLQDVGQDGFDSYHEMADWGVDVLKVGSTLGIGSIGMWLNDQVKMVSVVDSVSLAILANGPVYSMIETNYYGWLPGDKKYDLKSDLSIAAGDRKTRHDVLISESAENICTGIVKHENAQLMESVSSGDWQYLATYGAQTLVDDKDLLGMAVLYKKSNLSERVDDGQSHVAVLKPQQGKVTYYFLAAWGQEPGGITSPDQFKAYLEQELIKLDNPVSVKL
jgi:hypothetical protein